MTCSVFECSLRQMTKDVVPVIGAGTASMLCVLVIVAFAPQILTLLQLPTQVLHGVKLGSCGMQRGSKTWDTEQKLMTHGHRWG